MANPEKLTIREPEKTAGGLLENPPGLILVFDNWRGPKPKQRMLANRTMRLRTAVAAAIYHSDLYTSDDQRPQICCFAGRHSANAEAGSERVALHLKNFGIPENKIISRQTTNSTIYDITQIHSLQKELAIKRPTAIVTTNGHVRRTEQERVNHFAAHNPNLANHTVPLIYVVNPATNEFQMLLAHKSISILQRNTNLGLSLGYIIRAEGANPQLSHGLMEHIAYWVSAQQHLRKLQPLAQWYGHHKYTPEKLAWIRKTAKRFKINPSV